MGLIDSLTSGIEWNHYLGVTCCENDGQQHAKREREQKNSCRTKWQGAGSATLNIIGSSFFFFCYTKERERGSDYPIDDEKQQRPSVLDLALSASGIGQDLRKKTPWGSASAYLFGKV